MRILFTTIVICGDGRVYDLGLGEFPPSPPMKNGVMIIKESKNRIVTAFTCPQDHAPQLQSKKKKKKK